MKRLLIILLSFVCVKLSAQELYIFTEPASNMAARTIGVRVNNYLMPMQYSDRTAYRLDPEIMWGINKNWMLHANLYASNMTTGSFKFEGGSMYAKYRIYSNDDIHKHFRVAAFGKVSLIDNPYRMEHTEKHLYPDGNGGYYDHELLVNHFSDEQNLDGNHSGWQLGLTATQLLQKLALSTSISSISRWDNLGDNKRYDGDAPGAFHATFSAGYLLFPKNYERYSQTNFNVYAEFISQKLYDKPGYFVDAAPGIQFIFNSICRLDVGYRFQLAGTVDRFSTEQWLLRFEYNWLNVLARRHS